MRNVVTVILAAGESKRIKSNKSKIFHEVAGLSMIEYVYLVAKKISSKNIIIVCNKKNIIQISKKFPQAKVMIQKKQNGTAGAVLVAKKIIKKNQDVLILYGDAPLIKDISI